MPQDIETINLGGVNCFLLKAGDGFVLIDTGFAARRDQLEKELGLSLIHISEPTRPY